MKRASSWGNWKVISQLKCLNLSWLTAYSSPVRSTEIYSQVEWTGCQAITSKWILLHLFVTLILEMWFSLDKCQTELGPSSILCDTIWHLYVYLWLLCFPGALVCSPAWQNMPRHKKEKEVRTAEHEYTNLQCTEENAEYQMKGFQLNAHNFACGHILPVTLGDVMSHRQELMRSCRQEAGVTVSAGINGLLVTAEEHNLQLGQSTEVCACVHRHPEKTSIHAIPWRPQHQQLHDGA